MKIGLVTLGCDKNTVDSERYLAQLVAHGAEPAAHLDEADVIVVNTCGFIDAAKRESLDAIVEAGRRKADGTCRAVVAVGCLVQRHRAELEAELPEVDLFLGTSDIDALIPALQARGLVDEPDPLAEHPGVRVYTGDLPHVRYLKVSEGCDHGCAFCAIPLMRGRHRSFALADVVREAQLLELQGAREVNLVAQDLAHYGRDRRDGTGLAELLEALLAETGIPWLRMLYLYSAGITPRVLEVLAREPRLVKYLDVPIQHGSDAVLERMRRPERARTILERVARVRDAVPGIAIRTTCIVGFPGETEDDVRRLCDVLEEARFDRVGVFTFSPQEGTRAAALDDDVPEPVKRDRLERVSELQRAISAERYESLAGRTALAIVDRRAPGGPVEGRLAAQADDIDGITLLEDAPAGAVPGAIVECLLEDVVNDYDLRARVTRVVDLPVSAGRARGRALPVMAGAAAPGALSRGSFGR